MHNRSSLAALLVLAMGISLLAQGHPDGGPDGTISRIRVVVNGAVSDVFCDQRLHADCRTVAGAVRVDVSDIVDLRANTGGVWTGPNAGHGTGSIDWYTSGAAGDFGARRNDDIQWTPSGAGTVRITLSVDGRRESFNVDVRGESRTPTPPDVRFVISPRDESSYSAGDCVPVRLAVGWGWVYPESACNGDTGFTMPPKANQPVLGVTLLGMAKDYSAPDCVTLGGSLVGTRHCEKAISLHWK